MVQYVYLLSVVLMEDTVIDNTFAFPKKIYSIWSQFEFNFWMTKIEGNQLNCNIDLQWPQILRRLRRSKIWIFPPKMATIARVDSTIGFWRENSNDLCGLRGHSRPKVIFTYIFKCKRLIEERIKCLAMDFGFELAFFIWHQVDLDVWIRSSTHIQCRKLRALDRSHV